MKRFVAILFLAALAPQLVDVIHNSDQNTIEVIWRQPQLQQQSLPGSQTGPVLQDKLWKDIWGVDKDGKIIRMRQIRGRHVPAQLIDEQLIFPPYRVKKPPVATEEAPGSTKKPKPEEPPAPDGK